MKLRTGLCTLALGGLVCLANSAFAQPAGGRGPGGRGGPRVIAENLDNPSGVAVQPGTGAVFVAHHGGVARFTRNEDRTWAKVDEIGAFPTDVYGKGPIYEIGPLGLAFLDAQNLIVGEGSRKDGEEVVRIFKIAAAAPSSPAPSESAVFTLGPIKAGDKSALGEGNYYAVAVTGGAIYVTSNGDDTKGWIARSVVTNGKPGPLEAFIATKPLVNVDAPCGIAVNAAGDLVVGQMGEITAAKDSLLCVYDAKTGALKSKLKTDLNDLVGLAYSPDGKLYGVDFSWMDAAQGGLFELTIAGETVTSRKVVALDKPTALAFEPTGALLVTVFGTPVEGAATKSGQLIRIGVNALTGAPPQP